MSKADSTVDYAVLEHCVRDVLGESSLRAMAVLNPLKVVLTNWPEGETKTVGNEVRLKGAYIVRCDDCVKDAEGNVIEVHCTVDMDSFSGSAGADRKIKGKTLHWVPVDDCIPFEARLYEPLLNDDVAEEEDEEVDKKDFISRLNPESLKVCRGFAEKVIAEAETGTSFQFLRTGYFCKDPDSTAELPVYNRTVGLRDTFAKQTK